MKYLLQFSILATFLFLFSCSSTQTTEIFVPEFQPDFYEEVLSSIDKKIDESSVDLALLEQKRYFCGESGWPMTCLQALDQLKAAKGMTQSLFQSNLAYYTQQGAADEIVALFDQWGDRYPTSDFRKLLISGLVELDRRKEALVEIKSLLAEEKQIATHAFVAEQYLALSDTNMAVYHMSKVWKSDSSNAILLAYGEVLLNRGYEERALQVLNTYQKKVVIAEEVSLKLADIYQDNGYGKQSRNALKPYASNKDIAFRIAASYQQDVLPDSAILFLDTILLDQPENLMALSLKAALYEQKGWFSSSLRFYEQAHAVDSTDTVIQGKMALIRRKIAYLQRQKAEENRLPVLELESKKINNE